MNAVASDLSENQKELHIAMDLADNTLQIPALSTQLKCDQFWSICLGMDWLHKNKIVYRDPYLRNFFYFSSSRTAKLGDFGEAKSTYPEKGTAEPGASHISS